MNRLTPLNVPALLRQYGLHPDQSLGQNFLIDEHALEEIISAAEISAGDDVLEIGPGLGSLTRHLGGAGRNVIAVELDQRLLPLLREVLRPYPNVQVIHGDILELDPADLMPAAGYLVVANIPYNITSALIRYLLESRSRPERLILTVQREVAERICAQPGEMSLLALSVQVYGHPTIKARIPAGAFYPAPEVDSAVIRIDLYDEPRIPTPELEQFFRLSRAGFSQKRKNLRNAISAGMAWSKPEAESILRACGIDPSRRAESLSLEEWRKLVLASQQG